MDEVQRRLAEIALDVAAEYGFGLAGGSAVHAHGILERPSEEFATAVSAVRNAYRRHEYEVTVLQQFDTFARLMVADPVQAERPYKVELAANWRSMPPVLMGVGPVLHVDDVVAGKMSALFTRAEPRDFLDVDAALATGRYTREQVIALAEQADPGFDRQVFAELLVLLERYPDRRFAAYGADAAALAGMRQRFAAWRAEILRG